MVLFCRNCLMPDTRPRVVFSDKEICNGCLNSISKIQVNWSERRKEFIEMVKKHKRSDGGFDCLVPWSGGKDSSYIAYMLKFEFGLNPLLVTFSPLIPNQIGIQNRNQLLKLGFNHIYFSVDSRVSSYLSKRFFIERGNPKVHWDAGINAVPISLAVRLKIPLVFYAEHGESEYGGKVLSEEHKKIRDITEILEHQIGDDPINWVDANISKEDLYPYVLPSEKELNESNIKVTYFAYFFPWDVNYNYQFVKEKIDFKIAEDGRTEGTFTNYDSLDDYVDGIYYYMQYIKFGFGRATRDASRLIQRGKLNRKEGLKMVKKYDDEFPANHFKHNLDFLKINETEFAEIVDKHRNQEIWKFEGNSWKLRFPPK